MESCRIPIEVCEAIMDSLPTLLPGVQDFYESRRKTYGTLYACALTCRAWRIRAQWLLWASPHLLNERRLARFTAVTRTAPIPLIVTLWLHRSTFVRSTELFMHTFPNLRQLVFHITDFTCGPPLSILRMRLPFFASVTVLRLLFCQFRSWRTMLDVVWAFPNLATLELMGCEFKYARLSTWVGGPVDLPAICKYLRACQKLTELTLGLKDVSRVLHQRRPRLSVFTTCHSHRARRRRHSPEPYSAMLLRSCTSSLGDCVREQLLAAYSVKTIF